MRFDSRFRTGGSSPTDFSVQLPYPLQMPEGTRCFVTAMTFPHSWYNVQAGISDRLHVVETRTVAAVPQKKCRALQLDAGNYTSLTIAAALQTALNDGSLFAGSMTYSVQYLSATGTLRIQLATATGGTTDATARFQLPGLEEVSSPAWKAANWTGAADVYSVDDPDSMADFLRLAPVSAPTTLYMTGLLNVSPVDTLYLHSSLSTGDSLGPRGESDIIQRIPVTSSYGYQEVYLPSGSDEEWFDVSRSTLQNLTFRLSNVYGKTIDLNGGTVSLELTFALATM